VKEQVVPAVVHVPVIVEPLSVPSQVPFAPVALLPLYVTDVPLTEPVYETLPWLHEKFVLQPFCVITHVSFPQLPPTFHVPPMLEQEPPPLLLDEHASRRAENRKAMQKVVRIFGSPRFVGDWSVSDPHPFARA
jgi:hypothetical protein